jgi:hypothetical protein
MRIQLAVLACAVATLGLPGASGAADLSPQCRPVVAAMEKSLQTNHSTLATHGADSVNGVTVDGTTWLQVRGQWRKSPLSVQANIAMSRENLKEATSYTCKALPDAVVDGKPAAIWATHTVVDTIAVDSRIAIARATGLVVSVENRHAGETGPADIVTHYDYGNVKAPL